jgi:hypothetical protein
VLRRALLLHAGDEVAQALELVVDPGHLLVEGLRPQVQVLAAGGQAVAELLPGHPGRHRGGGGDRVLPLEAEAADQLGGLLVERRRQPGVGLAGGGAGGGAAHREGHADDGGGAEEGQDHDLEHGGDGTEGV